MLQIMSHHPSYYSLTIQPFTFRSLLFSSFQLLLVIIIIIIISDYYNY